MCGGVFAFEMLGVFVMVLYICCKSPKIVIYKLVAIEAQSINLWKLSQNHIE